MDDLHNRLKEYGRNVLIAHKLEMNPWSHLVLVAMTKNGMFMEKTEESNQNVSGKDFVDFEFRLEDSVTMLPADELFFDGKLVSLQLSTIRRSMTAVPSLTDVKLTHRNFAEQMRSPSRIRIYFPQKLLGV
ncbi:Uncharacterized protein Fot_09602 [Forsythia ovata]|uniref:Uncharacterized protein n=1 Tax=Forsythia ovata TaxID=205694 RepID=A0ABD1WEU5_9LAMI